MGVRPPQLELRRIMEFVYGTPVKILRPFYANTQPHYAVKTGLIIGVENATSSAVQYLVRLDSGLTDFFYPQELEEIVLANN